jgi:hypothetical protein
MVNFDNFFRVFDKIKPRYFSDQIYLEINQKIMSDRDNPDAIFLSILNILREKDKKKFKIMYSSK